MKHVAGMSLGNVATPPKGSDKNSLAIQSQIWDRHISRFEDMHLAALQQQTKVRYIDVGVMYSFSLDGLPAVSSPTIKTAGAHSHFQLLLKNRGCHLLIGLAGTFQIIADESVSGAL